MSSNSILAATTSAGNSSAINVVSGRAVTFTSSAILGSGETGILQISPDGGASYFNVRIGGTVQQLDPDNTALTAYGPGLFRIAKSATSAAIGIIAID